MSIANNIEILRQHIREHCVKGGNSYEDVLLLAVTKTYGVDVMREAIACGVGDVGENKVQELIEKRDILGDEVRFHLIGHLQTNKVRFVTEGVALIHSLDRLSLLKELQKRGEREDVVFRTLLQVNVSEEDSKFGVSVKDIDVFLEEVEKTTHVKVDGLMTMAPHYDNPEDTRWIFHEMKQLFDNISNNRYNNTKMTHLSMGMTNDYKVALEEGATIIRVGSAIFGERNYL